MSGKQLGTPASPRRAIEPGAAPGRELLVSLISLGCPKNLVDSEMILGRVGGAGLRITPAPEDADIILINTCGFIDRAKEESINTILEACEIKRASATPKKVVVAGCLAQRYGGDLRTEIPEVDAIIGLGQYGDIGEVLRDLFGEDTRVPALRIDDPNLACTAEVGRLRLTPAHYAYVRISEGCDNPCTFCAIPRIRGRFRSKPIPALEAEVRELVASGAREIVLISQDSTSYGVDLDGKYLLPEMLERLAAVEGVRWIRLLYIYPACFSEAMIEAVASIPKVLKYIDIPLQHISDAMLRRMGRRLDERGTRKLLERMRERIPGLYLRTTFITGFPGEDERDFAVLKDFVRDFRFERLGAFAYSREEGTPAYRMKDPIPESVAEARWDELMLLQQEVAFEHNRRRRGEVVEVLIDGRKGKDWTARSHGEAPDIDPVILIRERRQRPGADGSPRLDAGLFARVRITGSRGYDLKAEPAEEAAAEPIP